MKVSLATHSPDFISGLYCFHSRIYFSSSVKHLPLHASIPQSSHNSFLSIDRNISDQVLPFRNICHEMSHLAQLFLRLMGTSGMSD